MDLATLANLHAERQSKERRRNIHRHPEDNDCQSQAPQIPATKNHQIIEKHDACDYQQPRKPISRRDNAGHCQTKFVIHKQKILFCYEAVFTSILTKVHFRSMLGSAGTARVQRTERGWFSRRDISARPGRTGGSTSFHRLLNKVQNQSTLCVQ